MSWYIYGLRRYDQVGVFRYIGLTTRNPQIRFKEHLVDALVGKDVTPKGYWLKKHYLAVIWEVIEECPKGDNFYLAFREQFWIAIMREKFGNISSSNPLKNLNLTDGGDGAFGRIVSETERQKAREAKLGANHWSYGMATEDHPHFGLKHSEEWNSNVAKGTKLAMSRPEVIENHRRAMANQPKRTCPHCSLTGKGGNMTRYHFDNCKNK
jgi:hypothetical protein